MKSEYPYLVLHYSQNWMMDGLAVERCKTLKKAREHIEKFRGSDSHKNDTFELVRVVCEGKAVRRGKKFGLKEKA